MRGNARVAFPRGAVIGALTAAFLALTPRGGTCAPACGETITSSVELDADLHCTGNGLIVGAPKVTIDLAGFTIEGDGDVGDVGIDNTGGFEKVAIKNGVISEFGVGMILGGNAQKNTLTNVTVFGCTDHGVHLDGADLTKIKECTLNGNSSAGILVGAGATGNTIEKSTAVGNGGPGIEIDGDDNTVKKTDVTVNDDGIVLAGTGNTASSCGVYRNFEDGVDVRGSGNAISKSTIIGNLQEGVDVNQAAGAVVEKNIASGNRQHGVFVQQDSDGTIVKKNEISGNELEGIGVESNCDGVVVDDNTAIGNHTDGIATDNTSTTVKKNAANANGQLGIAAPVGVIDGGGNEAGGNADGTCTGVVCR